MAPAMALEAPQTQQWSDACLNAARAATECADWCIHQSDAALQDCVRGCLDTAVLCSAAPRLLTRESDHERTTLQACREVADACAKQCASHEDEHQSLTRCAAACREAAEACASVLESQR